ncbi:hypothetical protein M0R45_009568 [Rubus argutus]|uniref:Uncharacterized protein n=1 Tax=Rubus argutus TaxID=59490 RepID=A0AAW1Y8A3_RUBAR
MALFILIILGLLLVFLFSAFFVLQSWISSPKSMVGIPGSLGWLVVGEGFSFISEFSSPSGIYNFMDNRQQRYGKVFKTFVLGRFTVFMSGREASKMFFLQSTGEKHQLLRRLIAEPLSVDALKKYFQFINNLEILEDWPGRTVLVLEEASTFTLKVIANIIMSLEPAGEEQEKFRTNFKLISSSFASLPFKLPGTAFHSVAHFYQARDRMYVILDSIISERRNGEGFQHDFLESLIMKHSKVAGSEDDKDKLTDKQLTDNVLTLLVAGHDTTTAALTWVIKFLGENPAVLEQLRDKHRQIQAN